MTDMDLDFSHIRLTERPLVVCDVDDVVLNFVTPLIAYLKSVGYELLPRSFKLTGNIISLDTQLALDGPAVKAMLQDFFADQEAWQTPIEPVVETLKSVSDAADVIFLTAMPPRYRQQRRRLLDRLGLDFPLLASEQPKGPILHHLHAARPLPTVFIDDMAHNLNSVRDHVPDCLLIHMMPDSPLHLLAPRPDGVVRATDWPHAEELIRAHFLP